MHNLLHVFQIFYKDRFCKPSNGYADQRTRRKERSIICEEESEPPEKVTRVDAGAAAVAVQSKSSFLMKFDQILEESGNPEAPSSSSPSVQILLLLLFFPSVQMQSYFSGRGKASPFLLMLKHL